jgi:hypothetical protein
MTVYKLKNHFYEQGTNKIARSPGQQIVLEKMGALP